MQLISGASSLLLSENLDPCDSMIASFVVLSLETLKGREQGTRDQGELEGLIGV